MTGAARLVSQDSVQGLFVENLPAVDRLAAAVARRHGLYGDDGDDFTSWIRLRLVEDDYEILRKFRGESSLMSYLAVVITMLGRDYVVQRVGRWRPSAAAVRGGRIAVRLETLVHRRGHSFGEAAEILRTSGETRLSDAELAILFRRLPPRQPLRPIQVEDSALASVPGEGGADVLLQSRMLDEEHDAVVETLARVIEDFAPEDRIVLKLRFWDGLAVAEIARGLAIEQKPLYRRLERLLRRLRDRLVEAGLTADRARQVLEEVP